MRISPIRGNVISGLSFGFLALVGSLRALAGDTHVEDFEVGAYRAHEERSTNYTTLPDGTRVITSQTTLTYKNAAGQIVMESSRDSTETIVKNSLSAKHSVDIKKTFDGGGGYTEIVTDDTVDLQHKTRHRTDTTSKYGADGAMTSGERYTRDYIMDPGKANAPIDEQWSYKNKKLERWKPETKSWVLASAAPQAAVTPNNQVINSSSVIPLAGMDGGLGTGANAALPPFAGPQSQIIVDIGPPPSEGGANGVLVLTEDQQDQKRYFRVTPTVFGTLVLAADLGKQALKSISLVKNIDAAGQPQLASTCDIGAPAHIPGTNVVVNPPAQGPAITEMPSSVQPGDMVNVHIANANPSTTKFLIDGKEVRSSGISDNSATLRLSSDTPLGKRQIQLVSDGKKSNTLNFWIVQLYAGPVAESQPGVDQIITMHVDGLDANAKAQLQCEIGGAATMKDGGTTATVEVHEGIAIVHTRGTHAGHATLRFHLIVDNPQFR